MTNYYIVKDDTVIILAKSDCDLNNEPYKNYKKIIFTNYKLDHDLFYYYKHNDFSEIHMNDCYYVGNNKIYLHKNITNLTNSSLVENQTNNLTGEDSSLIESNISIEDTSTNLDDGIEKESIEKRSALRWVFILVLVFMGLFLLAYIFFKVKPSDERYN